MKRTLVLIVAWMLSTIGAVAHADSTGVWRYVDAQTFAIIRLDLTRADYKAAADWLRSALKAHKASDEDIDLIEADIEKAPAKQMLTKLQQAGAKELYGVLTLSDIPNDAGWFVVPIPAGADGQAIARALVTADAKVDTHTPDQTRLIDGNWTSAVVNDVVFYGRPAALDRILSTPATERPDLAKALQETGDAPLTAGIAPTDDTRKVIEQTMPKFPPPIGSPSTVFTRGLRRASIAIGLPPSPRLSIKIQSESPEAAQNLATLSTTLLNLARNDPSLHKMVPGVDQLLDAITPKAEADHLTVAVDGTILDKLGDAIVAGLANARHRAALVETASNLRSLSQGIMMYRNDHKGQWPDTLAQIERYIPPISYKSINANAFKTVMTDPRWPDRPNAYTYVKPNVADDKINWGDRLVIYEAFDKWPGSIAIAFADGHVEIVSDEAHARKLIGEAKAGPDTGL